MFERFIQCGVEKVMLEIQYRMEPLIREFPSKQFYEGRLQDDPSISQRSSLLLGKKTLSHLQSMLGTMMFHDLTFSQEDSSETSKSNNDEAEFVCKLIKKAINLITKYEQDHGFKSNELLKLQNKSQAEMNTN